MMCYWREGGSTCQSHEITANANHNHSIKSPWKKSHPAVVLVREAVSLGHASQQGRKDYCNFCFMPTSSCL